MLADSRPKGRKRQRAYLHASIWLASALVGVAAVAYAKLIAWAQWLYFCWFDSHPYATSATAPLLFVAATWLVQRFAQEARGSGIPQVLQAIHRAEEPGAEHAVWELRLVSLRTAAVKIISSTLGILGGASIGREGPTVQIAASLFAWVGGLARRICPEADSSAFLSAGAAAGVAAAFNTPLAGVTFVMEEIAEQSFGSLKQVVVFGVVISGITAQALAGNYLYFGRPSISTPSFNHLVLAALLVGLLGGVAGGVFARLLVSRPKIPVPGTHWARALSAGALCAVAGLWTHGSTAGSGYEVTRQSIESLGNATPGVMFPLWKLATTVLSYLSGMAGGIFSPCLSIGAGIGFSFAELTHIASTKACALLGMVAFFSGAVQAPLTAVVIVMEMTDQHSLVLPFMAAAFCAQSMGRRLMPVPLYRYLADVGAPGRDDGPAAGPFSAQEDGSESTPLAHRTA
jgi:H+/Cl- antiporter ClcA